jgi:hypothetical protein
MVHGKVPTGVGHTHRIDFLEFGVDVRLVFRVQEVDVLTPPGTLAGAVPFSTWKRSLVRKRCQGPLPTQRRTFDSFRFSELYMTGKLS